ncbi:MAG TPA: Ig-like domain-containing protein, partial [Gemmatimonadales bacterium]|nr:Ig-like domain-containing protein [Gemmatimonadales bacterium]
MIAAALLALLQQPATPAVPAPPPPATSPIAKVVVQPAEAAVLVGDSLRLLAVAYDSTGRELKEVSVSWFQNGGEFEGRVDSTGQVMAGSTGTLNVTALVRARRGGKAVASVARVTILPQPASKIAVSPAVTRLYVGQSLVLTAIPYAANDDRRYDEVVWSSDKPTVVSVTEDGRVTAKATGSARISARAGRASWSQAVTVAPNGVTQVSLAPDAKAVRTGDVVKLAF